MHTAMKGDYQVVVIVAVAQLIVIALRGSDSNSATWFAGTVCLRNSS